MTKLIVIDAGHGGKDPGAIGITGRKEKDFNLTIALKLRDLLQKNTGFEVKLTRETDVFVELSDRAKFANKLKADGFISIHANNTNTSVAGGYETWYTRDASKAFAELMHKKVLPVTGFKDRKVQNKSLAVCRETNMPAILLEAGFLSNAIEEAQLFTESFQNKYVAAIYEGLCEYFKLPATSKPSTSPYPEMVITVHTDEVKSYVGYSINNVTWIPSRPIGELLGGVIGYEKSKVTINGNPVETRLIDSLGYVTARDISNQLGARIFWEKENPSRVEIYPKL